MASEEQAKEVVDALLALRKILTQTPKQEYPRGLVSEDPEVEELVYGLIGARRSHWQDLVSHEAFHRFLTREMFAIHRLPAPPSVLRHLEEFLADFGYTMPAQDSKEKTPARATLNPERGILILNGKPLSLSSGEKFVLAALVEGRTASFSQLKGAHPRPDRVLKRLREKYPMLKKFILLPGGPGKGGYSTTIEPSQID